MTLITKLHSALPQNIITGQLLIHAPRTTHHAPGRGLVVSGVQNIARTY
ncbi:MAG: hypothetical protein GY820_15950 [Gammaproteobacteria bacterium]|nr:hypothetical protein [Gammaproteobacteria bacterium]